MEFAGVLPVDAPDPREEQRLLASAMPIPVMTLVPQPTLEDPELLGITSSVDGTSHVEISVAVSYTLWRNPADRSDPVNLAELDEVTRASIEAVPPWPRPSWLLERVERMRYPLVSEAVRTSWYRDAATRPTLDEVLVDHTRHIITNHFWRENGWPRHPLERPKPDVTLRCVNRSVMVRVNGADLPGAEIDTDPFVYAIGAELDGGYLTAVLPRDELPYIRIEFTERP